MIQTSQFQKQLYIGNKPQTCTILKRWGKLVNVGHLRLTEEILHQLRLVVYPIIHRVFLHFQVVLWDFWTINSIQRKKTTTINKGESFRDKKIQDYWTTNLGAKDTSTQYAHGLATVSAFRRMWSVVATPGGGRLKEKTNINFLTMKDHDMF